MCVIVALRFACVRTFSSLVTYMVYYSNSYSFLARARQMAAQRGVQMAQSFPLLMRPSVWRRLATAAASNEAAASEKPASPSVENTSRRVYLLNRTTPETTDLHTAIRALRAYSFAEKETVELSIKCNMSGKKVSPTRHN